MNAVILKRNGVSYPQRLPKSQKYLQVDISGDCNSTLKTEYSL